MKASQSANEAGDQRGPKVTSQSDRPLPINGAADGAPKGSELPVAPATDGKTLLLAKKPCDAPEGWCRVCERMSDIPILRSEDLLQGHREVLIIHGKEVYRLLCTRNGKLILQK